MIIKHTRCNILGVCQGLGADHCPDCDSFECEVACSPEPPRPTYPFAPGVIQGPDLPIQFLDDDGRYRPLGMQATLLILLLIVALALTGGFLAGYLYG